jgi:hypothetical protein
MKKPTLLVAAFALLVSACSALSHGSGVEPARATIRVDNEGFSDMTVYAVRSAQRVRLGLAPGHANTIFTVPSALMNGLTQLRFIADPIGGARASVSEEITVAPGDSVTLTIPPL